MKFSLTILGSNSAVPTSTRNPTSQLLNINEKYYLIDCGEGTQIQIRKYKIKMQRIGHIFISHLHGDHYFGLVGLLTTMHLLGRKQELHLYAPALLKSIIDIQLESSETFLCFPLIFHELEFDSGKILLENKILTVQALQMKHRIPCSGFLFKEKEPLRKLKKEMFQKYHVPVKAISDLRQGKDFITENGEIIKNDLFTYPPTAPRSYAYCSDTAYNEELIRWIKGVDLLYHEATFAADLEVRAELTFHSTTKQAATIARKAAVKRLIIGHYSARYKKLDHLLLEAESVFTNTELAIEGKEYVLPQIHSEI